MAWFRPIVHCLTAMMVAMAGDSAHARAVVEGPPSLDPVMNRVLWVTRWPSPGSRPRKVLWAKPSLSPVAPLDMPTSQVSQLRSLVPAVRGAVRRSGRRRLVWPNSSRVQGPRAAAAAALRDTNGDGLLSAARRYEAFGDRIAAGDAAAQAAVVFRGQGAAAPP